MKFIKNSQFNICLLYHLFAQEIYLKKEVHKDSIRYQPFDLFFNGES